jgi:hypothetical protein
MTEKKVGENLIFLHIKNDGEMVISHTFTLVIHMYCADCIFIIFMQSSTSNHYNVHILLILFCFKLHKNKPHPVVGKVTVIKLLRYVTSYFLK